MFNIKFLIITAIKNLCIVNNVRFPTKEKIAQTDEQQSVHKNLENYACLAKSNERNKVLRSVLFSEICKTQHLSKIRFLVYSVMHLIASNSCKC